MTPSSDEPPEGDAAIVPVIGELEASAQLVREARSRGNLPGAFALVSRVDERELEQYQVNYREQEQARESAFLAEPFEIESCGHSSLHGP